MTPRALYQDKIARDGFRADPDQASAVEALQRLADCIAAAPVPDGGFSGPVGRFFAALTLRRPGGTKRAQGKGARKGKRSGQVPGGVYLYGGVGRGKSMLMDLFFDSLPGGIKKRRVHFHAFMLETHGWLHQRRGGNVDQLLPAYAAHVAEELQVLCFDEFHVTDVADAMILGRLFTALLERGLFVVMTSNWTPERLYEGGLQRDRFLPFIALLKERLEVVHLNSPTDYRMEVRAADGRSLGELKKDALYIWPLGKSAAQKADDLFAGLTDCARAESERLNVQGRDIEARAAAGGVARFTFAALCERPHGAQDYLAVAQKFHTIFLEGVPKMGYDRRNEAKRLMTLIDVLYDHGSRLVVTADAAPENLYFGDDYAFEFKRTVSRLVEMRTPEYWEKQ